MSTNPPLSRPKLALLIPVLLIPSTSLVFWAMSRLLGPDLGYLIGFLFYWITWCLLVPLILLGRAGVRSLFTEEHPLFRRSTIFPTILLLLIIGGTVALYPPIQLREAAPTLLMVAIPVALINGVCEEILWRGVYVRLFPKNIWLAVIYPMVGFALWHLAPQLVFPAENGEWTFVLSTFFLGGSYGWIAYRTRSIKWPVISHSLGGILSLGGALAPSIISLLWIA